MTNWMKKREILLRILMTILKNRKKMHSRDMISLMMTWPRDLAGQRMITFQKAGRCSTAWRMTLLRVKVKSQKA